MKAQMLPYRVLGMAWLAAAAAPLLAQTTPVPPPTTASAPVANAALRPDPAAPTVLAPASAIPLAPAPNSPLTAGSAEILSLTQAGLDQSVIRAYITNSPYVFSLSPDHIIYLQGAGVSPQVITAMIRHDQALPTVVPPPPNPPAPFAMPAAPWPVQGAPQIVADFTAGPGDFPEVEEGYSVAEQPANVGPVRVPYPVKLNDPIIILRLPTFTVPCY
jgi:hypothetical protein